MQAPWFVAVIVTALVVGLLIGRAVTRSDNARKSGPTAAPLNPIAPDAPSPTSIPAAGGQPAPTVSGPNGPVPAPTAAPAPGSPRLLLDIRREEGPKTTAHFVLPGGRWVLGWAYDCSGKGGQGDFQITIYKPDGLPGAEGGVNQRGLKGSSVAAYTTTGERYLGVQTNCLWAIRVTA